MIDDRGRPPRPGRKPWFGPKRVGWGLSPRTWQGWLVLIIVVAVVALIQFLSHGH